ncbi:MAG: carbon starvation protein, predicted membrane protein [Solidesulfovibrio magneticus str. Maddingley MBC34]|uniref:Carbon starvation protein, predicted membrane protein n=1 Tax=Solidesulfovibrio magneticus str. Maddingley MBC34 TaxID=1206767 RepID=K6HF40_9BACT|nr:MAG: carbon starvation protein, predicted membrane protein [Solidesulfovibrio magneticus str. Maddingley MBC34]
MNAMTLVFAALCVFAIGYRFYGLFFTRKVLGAKIDRITPAIKMADGHDYVKTNKYVLFGHHFAAIAAAGPLLGPVLSAQFGYLPGTLWILIGCVLAGCVHDTVVLFASVRHKGRSLAYIATQEIGKGTGSVAGFAVLFILVLTLAGLSIAVVNAMHDSAWGTFTVFATIPIALIMGVYLHKWRDGDVLGASIIGVGLLFVAILIGPYVAASPTWGPLFNMPRPAIAITIPIYGFVASVLPVWLLLCPRDYLSTYLKIGTIAMLAIGIFYVRPDLQMPALTKFTHGGGPIIPGAVFPFLFITIACGALSGFHAIIGTGTTPKMLDNENNLLFVGFGAMLMEGFVAIMALIAACVLVPADYFAINTKPEVFATLGMATVDLAQLSQAVGENITGRPGGAVSLAVGMAHIFSSIPVMNHLMDYWYHFAIMFEAVFILTAVDTGTRVGRFFLQEMIGQVIPKFQEKHWMPGILSTSAIFTFMWGYLVYTGDISTIWPLFGMSNQLLAAVGLLIGTTMIIRMGKARYAWMTAVPGLSMVVITMWAGYLQIMNNYIPKGLYLLATLAVIVVVLMAIVIVGTMRRWMELLSIKKTVVDPYGDPVLEVVPE